MNSEPVSARPPSATYRPGKFVRCNKAGIIAGSLVAASLVVGLALASAGMVRARQAEAETALGAEAAQQVSDFLVGLFEVFDPGHPWHPLAGRLQYQGEYLGKGGVILFWRVGRSGLL